MKTNIFRIGPVVPAEHIIGYRRMRKDLESWATGPSCGLSLTGMHRTGKTSLGKELYNKIRAKKEKMLPLYLVLNKIVKDEGCDWYSTLLNCIVEELKEALREKTDEDDTLCALLDALEDALEEKRAGGEAPWEPLEKLLEEKQPEESVEDLMAVLRRFHTAKVGSMRFRNSFQKIFSTLTEAGWKTRIILDEFDYAIDPDTFREDADFELFRDLSNEEYGVGLLLISRRDLHLIEKKNRNNSVFSGAFNEYRLVGFRESTSHDGSEVHQDMTDYYNVLRENYGIELDEEEREELKFYTGWNPFLLSIFGHELAQARIDGRERQSLRSIYQDKFTTIRKYLDTVYQRLEDDEGADGVSYIQKLTGIVIGPCIDVIPDDVDLLRSLGYLQPINERDRSYQCISGIFTQYLSQKAVKADTWDYILETERIARRLIEREFDRGETPLTEEQWFAILAEAFLRVDGQRMNNSVYLRDIRVNRDSYGVELSVLDVISLKDCFRVIRAFWDSNFSGYFVKKERTDGTLEQWKVKFTECGKARNPLAHGNADFLDATARNRVNLYCEEIIRTVKNNLEIKTPAGVPASVKLTQSVGADG